MLTSPFSWPCFRFIIFIIFLSRMALSVSILRFRSLSTLVMCLWFIAFCMATEPPWCWLFCIDCYCKGWLPLESSESLGPLPRYHELPPLLFTYPNPLAYICYYWCCISLLFWSSSTMLLLSVVDMRYKGSTERRRRSDRKLILTLVCAILKSL